MPNAKYKRPCKMKPKDIKHYQAAHCYVFDDIDPKSTQAQTVQYRKHISNFCHTSPGFSEENFCDWWLTELQRYHRNELVIVYFHGEAVGRGPSYQWKFNTRPGKLNARNLFELTNRSKPDVFWILDCAFPVRFQDIPIRGRGHSDYTISGQDVPHFFSGSALASQESQGENSGYTYRLTSYLTDWVEQQKLKFGRRTTGLHRQSIPEIMRFDQNIRSNPLRMWERKTRKNARYDVYRFCIEPRDVRRDGVISFVRVHIQGRLKTRNGQRTVNDNSDSDNDYDMDAGVTDDSDGSDHDDSPKGRDEDEDIDVDNNEAQQAPSQSQDDRAVCVQNQRLGFYSGLARDHSMLDIDDNCDHRDPCAKRVKYTSRAGILTQSEGSLFVEETKEEKANNADLRMSTDEQLYMNADVDTLQRIKAEFD